MAVRSALAHATRGGIAATLAAGLLAAVLAEPADAAVCHTPGCGGSVYNTPSSGGYSGVTNCWSGSSSKYEGTTPPCVRTYGSASYNSWYYLPANSDSYNVRHFYDVDSFMAEGGCFTSGYASRSGPFAYDRRGKGRAWYKIRSDDRVYVNSVTCR